ncbi:LuxR C-terminal-related transcriptional regulator [Nonomuraea sp. NPDC049725]|uniref:helix-turn-helix transcriptional regulator n=1 Tax=Nonomuraea sp. NPDC049725 TaxID=3154508 RepID=UPI00342AA1A0
MDLDVSREIPALVARGRVELDRQLRRIEATRAALSWAAACADAREPAFEVVERFDRWDEVHGRMAELAAAARHQMLFLQPTDVLPLEPGLLRRGVAVRIVYQDGLLNRPAVQYQARQLALRGAESRTAPRVPARAFIVDDESALVPVDPADGEGGVLELRNRGVVEAMRALFEQVWSAATPWGEPAPRDDRGLTPRERELVRLLAEGHTDEVVSKKLAISVRTVRRLASEVMAKLEASSRFEAGVKAARRGWL